MGHCTKDKLSTSSPQISYPAEWSPQSAVMLAWPHTGTDWVEILDEVERVYVDLVAAISLHEKVLLLCVDNQQQSRIVAQLKQHGGLDISQIIFQRTEYNDTWSRDYGPVSILKDNRPGLLDFTFNGWGNKFDAELDNAVNGKLAAAGVWSETPIVKVDYILEGGSIDTDGEGTIMTTSACLLNPNRNPQATREMLESLLHEKLGCQRILWLEHGYLAGDDTDSHIDTLARFCDPDTIVYMACHDQQDEHYLSLKSMEAELQQFKTASGKPYTLLPVYMPAPIFDPHGQRLPASYVNFLIINHAVLLPVYQDSQSDLNAIKQITRAFPQHQVVPVDCKSLIMQHGSLHCVTMQLLQGVI